MNTNSDSSGTGVIIGVVIVLLVLIVGWLAYTQGFFGGARSANTTNDTGGLQINVGGGTGGGNGQGTGSGAPTGN